MKQFGSGYARDANLPSILLAKETGHIELAAFVRDQDRAIQN
jgi:hypothetical protein